MAQTFSALKFKLDNLKCEQHPDTPLIISIVNDTVNAKGCCQSFYEKIEPDLAKLQELYSIEKFEKNTGIKLKRKN